MSALILCISLMLALAGAIAPVPKLAPGTNIKVELESRLGSKTARIGQPVRAKVEQKVKDHGRVLLPKGCYLVGVVTEDSQAQKDKRASFGVLFSSARTKRGRVLVPRLRAAIVRIVPDKVGQNNNPNNPADGAFKIPGWGGGLLPFPRAQNPGKKRQTKGPYAMFDRANGKPVAFAIMMTFNGAGRDLGGLVMALGDGDISLDSGTSLEVRVLH